MIPIAIGWGLTERRSLSAVPKHVEMKYMQTSKCKDIWKLLRREITESMICALPRNDKPWRSGTFKGDSGGPLITKSIDDHGQPTGEDICVGLVSWGIPVYSINGGFPRVYAKVSSVSDWIREELNKPSPREEPVKPGPVRIVLDRLLQTLLLMYGVASVLAHTYVTLPFLLRFSGMEKRLGIDLDQTISSIRFALILGFLLIPGILFVLRRVALRMII